MSKVGYIIIIGMAVAGTVGGIMGYYSKISVIPISGQVDMKSGNTNIHWSFADRSTCVGDCRNYSSSSSSSSSWGGGSSGGGGGGK